MPEAVIVSAARSPIGRAFKGALGAVRADDLTATVVNAALAAVPELDPDEVEDLMLGCGSPGGEQGFNLARAAAVIAGLDDLPGTTVNRYCASSLQTTRMAMHAIRAGEGDAYVSAGVEVVSRYTKGSADSLPDTQNPAFDTARERSAARADGNIAGWSDPRSDGELPDIYMGMGLTAEHVAHLCGVTREDMDEFAARSQNRTEEARERGFWDRDIVPITLPDGTIIDTDESPRSGVTTEALASLGPAFRPDGDVTAGNSCPLNDGAAALVIMSDVRAEQLGITPLARIVATGVSALSPEIMGLGPVEASKRALSRAGLDVKDLDLVEINEAFAAQVIPSYRHLGLDPEIVNVNGGAIAVGHPFGMTGARITSTLINGLQERDGRYGLETMCVGGGQGMAMVIERLR